jgi:hypothetical protein
MKCKSSCLFILIHIPGSLRRGAQAADTPYHPDTEEVLNYAQSALDPSHGAFNFILYVLLDEDLLKDWKDFITVKGGKLRSSLLEIIRPSKSVSDSIAAFGTSHRWETSSVGNKLSDVDYHNNNNKSYKDEEAHTEKTSSECVDVVRPESFKTSTTSSRNSELKIQQQQQQQQQQHQQEEEEEDHIVTNPMKNNDDNFQTLADASSSI